MAQSYLVLKELAVERASSLNNFYCIGSPALTSYAGFVTAACMALSKTLGATLTPLEFSVIIHQSTHLDGKEKHVRYMRAEKKADQAAPPSMKEEYKCDLTVSFVIKTHFDLPADGWGDETQALSDIFIENKDDICETISQLRVAGGMITNNIFEKDIAACTDQFFGKGSVESMVRGMSPGYFIATAEHLYREYLDLFDGDAVKAVAHATALYLEREDSDQKNRYRRAQRGWVTPTNIGYVGLTEPRELAGARDSTPVVYAEPVTGLVEYIFAPREMRRMKTSPDGASRALLKNQVTNQLYTVISQKGAQHG